MKFSATDLSYHFKLSVCYQCAIRLQSDSYLFELNSYQIAIYVISICYLFAIT